MTSLNVVIKIIKQANTLLAKRFRALGMDAVRLKKDEEIVTEADLASNKFITRELLKYFPQDDIISEEADRIDNPGKKTWYIDPLDGSSNFAYGFREFAVCLARTLGKNIKLGLVGLPVFKEIFYAQSGGPAYLNGKKIKVSSTRFNHGSRSLILVCGGRLDSSQRQLNKIMRRMDVKKIRFRSFGSAGVELCSVACGRADGCLFTELKPWDVLAGVLLVRAAGGRCTNFKGQEWRLGDETLVASNGLIHRELLKLVK